MKHLPEIFDALVAERKRLKALSKKVEKNSATHTAVTSAITALESVLF